MNRYILYFDILSSGQYKSVEQAAPRNDLEGLDDLIESLASCEDLVSIYLTKSKIRVQIWGDTSHDKCTLEINNGRHGVSYSKLFMKSELKYLSTNELESYIKTPLEKGFSAEPF